MPNQHTIVQGSQLVVRQPTDQDSVIVRYYEGIFPVCEINRPPSYNQQSAGAPGALEGTYPILLSQHKHTDAIFDLSLIALMKIDRLEGFIKLSCRVCLPPRRVHGQRLPVERLDSD